MVMDGIYRGEMKSKGLVADGIVKGLPKAHEKMKAMTMGVKGSATQYAAGVFGAGAIPQAVGDSARHHSGGMAMAHSHANALKRGRKALEEHILMHNK